MKQTAVEWFAENIKGHISEGIRNEVCKQAKAMEKEQIINAREDGHVSTYAEYGETPKCYLDGGHEQYYNETFGETIVTEYRDGSIDVEHYKSEE